MSEGAARERTRGYGDELLDGLQHATDGAVGVGQAAVDVAAELLLGRLAGAHPFEDHRPLKLGDEGELAADELGHGAVSVLLRHGEDLDAVPLEAAL